MFLKQPFVRLVEDSPVERFTWRRAIFAVLLALVAALMAARPVGAQTAPLSLESLTISPARVIGGTAATGTVKMNRVVPPSTEFGVFVSLTSSSPNVASVPQSVNVPVGKQSATFTISTVKVPSAQNVTITARWNAVRTAQLGVDPAAPPAPILVIRPSSLNFGQRAVGAFGGRLRLTLLNAGTGPLVVGSFSVIGTNPGDFRLAGSSGINGSIAPGRSAWVEVEFSPSAVGQRSASLRFVSNAAGSPHQVGMSGVGLGPVALLTPATLTFASQQLGSRSASQFVNLANIGTAPLTIFSARIEGAQAAEFQLINSRAPIVLPVQGNLRFEVAFAPAAEGRRVGRLAFETNAVDSPHFVTLSGTGAPAPVPPAQFEPALPVGEAVPAVGRLGIFRLDPSDQDQDVSAIRRIADDGSHYVLDYAGTALIRIRPGTRQPSIAGVASEPARAQQLGDGTPEILVDTTRQDPTDGVGLARLLRVETARNGVSVVLALRADNTRGIYRLEGSTLTRLGLLPGPVGPAELEISDTGQIAYVAPNSAGQMALFQTFGSATREWLRQGLAIPDGSQIGGFADLSTNGAGDMAVQVELVSGEQAVLRISQRRGTEVVALTGAGGSRVARDLFEHRGNQRPAILSRLQRPRIGPDGSVSFLGAGAGFVNVYVDGGGRMQQPMLVGANWGAEERTFDYKGAANGAVVLRAAPGGQESSGLFLSLPSGGLLEVIKAGDRLQPVGRPIFGPAENETRFFFQARVMDQQPDRQGRPRVGLFRAGLVNGRLFTEPVALPGDPVPGKRGAVLISVTQRPVVTARDITFGILFGSGRRSAVPTASLFRVPLGGKLADGSLVADEGAEVPNAGRLAMLRDLSYQPDGSLILSGLLPGAGPVIAAVPSSGARSQSVGARVASIASTSARIQAVTVSPLLAIGQALAPSDRQLLALIGPLLPLGTDRQLIVARYSQPDGLNGEGLFTVDKNRLVEAVAATGDTAAAMASTPFSGFADTAEEAINPPAVAPGGNLVFKARLAWGAAESQGVFQWSGADPAAVAVAEPNPDDLRVLPTDQGPYGLERWVAAPSGSAYLMAQPAGGKARLYRRSPTAGAPIQWLVVPDVTPVNGPTPVTLTQMTGFVVDGAGQAFVAGTTSQAGALFRVDGEGAAARLTTIAAQGQAVPPALDGTNVQGFTFNGSFTLLPDSARGSLLFQAQVTKSGSTRQGLFRLGAQGVETIMVENLEVGSARELTYGTLATTPARQTVNGISAYATFYNGRWSIYRWQAGVTKLVAQEGQALPAGAKVVSLDPGPVLSLPPGSGPVFTLNENGDVAFLATDGKAWGIYLFSGT